MSKHETTPLPLHDLQEKQFRDGRVWHSFKAVLYSGLSAATFIGVLGELMKVAITAVKGGAGLDLPTSLVMGGFLGAGAGFTYLAQKEWTDVKCIEDERLARINAECMYKQQHPELNVAVSQAQEVTKAAVVETADQTRKDGKLWQVAVEKTELFSHVRG